MARVLQSLKFMAQSAFIISEEDLVLRVTALAFAAVLVSNPATAVMIDFAPADGGAKTLVSFSGSNTVEFANNTIVSNFSLGFDLINDGIPSGDIFLQTLTQNISGLTVSGSESGTLGVSNFRLRHVPSGDEIFIDVDSPTDPASFTRTVKDETLTFGGSVVVNLDFSRFVSGGTVVPNSFLDGQTVVTVSEESAVVTVPPSGLLLSGALAALALAGLRGRVAGSGPPLPGSAIRWRCYGRDRR